MSNQTPPITTAIDAFNSSSLAASELRDALSFMTLAMRCLLENKDDVLTRHELNGYDTVMGKLNGLADKAVMSLDLLWEAHKGADHE